MKNTILLIVSLFFYAWGEPVYILLMIFSSVTDYFHGSFFYWKISLVETMESKSRAYLITHY